MGTIEYYLLFIYTFYLYKLDASRNNFILNSQNNDTTIFSEPIAPNKYNSSTRSEAGAGSGAAAADKMNIQSAENCK